jgi:hypothetical protein
LTSSLIRRPSRKSSGASKRTTQMIYKSSNRFPFYSIIFILVLWDFLEDQGRSRLDVQGRLWAVCSQQGEERQESEGVRVEWKLHILVTQAELTQAELTQGHHDQTRKGRQLRLLLKTI